MLSPRQVNYSKIFAAAVATHTYDALGRRIEKYDAAAETATRYYYDDQHVLLETDYDDHGRMTVRIVQAEYK